jgi:ribosome-binding protein aMBF1 (putative translation factor)
MIENDLQLRVSKTKLAEFKTTLQTLEQDQLPKKAKTVRRNATLSLISELEEDIQTFEHLRGSNTEILNIHDLEELPNQLIQARVARGFTQAELAAKLKMKPQQIQRYEASKYASASLSRVLEVARVLQNAK